MQGCGVQMPLQKSEKQTRENVGKIKKLEWQVESKWKRKTVSYQF
jgi:hypothetical protein